jgi:glycosyltransferase involved in cell wall biosynthesis
MSHIAVVIPHFRQARFLAECLDSVIAQRRPADEIIVVDSSPEDTAPIIERYASPIGLAPQAPMLRHLIQPAAGVAAARNAGLAATTCELVSFLDADNVATPDRLERQVAALDSSPDAVLCHGALVPIDRSGAGYASLPHYGSEQVSVEAQLGWLIERNRIAADTVCLRREQAQSIGGFCEESGVREDYDLWLRMASLGRFVYCDAPLARYRRHETNLSNNERYMFEWEAGALRRLDWDRTRDALGRAFPDAEQRLTLEAEVRLRRGEEDIAVQLFVSLARLPRAAAALFHLSHIAIRRGSLDHAESMLRRALGEEPANAALWNNLGVVFARAGRPRAAENAFAQALHLNPLYQDASQNLRKSKSGPWKATERRLRPQLMPLAAVAA